MHAKYVPFTGGRGLGLGMQMVIQFSDYPDVGSVKIRFETYFRFQLINRLGFGSTQIQTGGFRTRLTSL